MASPLRSTLRRPFLLLLWCAVVLGAEAVENVEVGRNAAQDAVVVEEEVETVEKETETEQAAALKAAAIEAENRIAVEMEVASATNPVTSELTADLKGLLSDFNSMLKADEADELFDRILLDQVDDLLAEEKQDSIFLDQLNAHVESTRNLHSMSDLLSESDVQHESSEADAGGLDLDMLAKLLDTGEGEGSEALGGMPVFDEL